MSFWSSLFGAPPRIVTKRVFPTRRAALLDLAQQCATGLVVLYWFEDTEREVREALGAAAESTRFIAASTLEAGGAAAQLSGRASCFAELWPTWKREQELLSRFAQLGVPLPSFTSVGLDEPIFDLFGGERLRELMQKLGMSPDERIEHAMVDRAIDNARKKLERSARNSQARSRAEWFQLNQR